MTSWASYFDAQRGPLVTAVVTGAIALAVRLLLEARHASDGSIALAILGAAAVPWCAGVVRMLARPDCEPLREWLPFVASRR
jgi:hypothetical protein